MKNRLLALLAVVALLLPVGALAADTAREMYARALADERAARQESAHATVQQFRHIVAEYELLVRRHRASGYADNALWQAANVAALAFERFGEDVDRKKAATLYKRLASEYPTSKLVPRAQEALAAFRLKPEAVGAAQNPEPRTSDLEPRTPIPGVVALKAIHRELLPDGVRVTIDLDAEVAFRQEEVAQPRRVFFDLKGVRPVATLQDKTLKFDDDVVREIRLGRHPQNTTRIVLDMDGVEGYSVYPLYSPYRLVIDFKRAAATKATAAVRPPVVASLPAPPPATASNPVPVPPPPVAQPLPDPEPIKMPLPSKAAAGPAVPPAAATANSNGKFSISRQLGLGVSRIVIDAGHGGHDPGAQAFGVSESAVTLDVAQRLQKLLQKQPGVDVVMTRDADVFIPLQERTAIANREGADLFLSVHVNASRNPQARGIETYFLNFATNPEAEAVAARENAGSGQGMHNLPDIVKAIALNNKINESRDFAETVQRAMVKKIRARNKAVKDLGVKQAPFVVLIGAGMPSVLAEISFVTNKQEGTLLKSPAYRQQIAQALLDAVLTYQKSLKKMDAIAGKKATTQ